MNKKFNSGDIVYLASNKEKDLMCIQDIDSIGTCKCVYQTFSHADGLKTVFITVKADCLTLSNFRDS